MDLLSTLSQSKSKSSSLSIVKKVYGEVPAAAADDFFADFFCLRINLTKFYFRMYRDLILRQKRLCHIYLVNNAELSGVTYIL